MLPWPWPRDGYQQSALALLLLLLAASCIAPPYPEFLLMQHAPTLAATAALGAVARRYAVSRASFTALVAFLALHTLGARYLYSYVPYDAWAESLCGVSITHACGFTRNHYDRLVHFSYGLLVAVPIREFERRHWGLSERLASALAVECILATSAAYELAEWLVAATFAPDWAETFLGCQGDPFDAQKDMALATAGAILSVSAATFAGRRRRRSGG